MTNVDPHSSSDSENVIESIAEQMNLQTASEFTATEDGDLLIHIAFEEEALLFSQILGSFKWIHYGVFKGFRGVTGTGQQVVGIIAGGWKPERHFAAALQARMLCRNIPHHIYFGRTTLLQSSEETSANYSIVSPQHFHLGSLPDIVLEIDQGPKQHPLEEQNSESLEAELENPAIRKLRTVEELESLSGENATPSNLVSVASLIDTPLVWDWCHHHFPEQHFVDHGATPFLLGHQSPVLPQLDLHNESAHRLSVTLHPVDPLMEWPLHQAKPTASSVHAQESILRMIQSAESLVTLINNSV